MDTKIRDSKTMGTPPKTNSVSDLPIEEIERAVAKVRFGTVQLIIQDGRIVQIDTTEKKRLV